MKSGDKSLETPQNKIKKSKKSKKSQKSIKELFGKMLVISIWYIVIKNSSPWIFFSSHFLLSFSLIFFMIFILYRWNTKIDRDILEKKIRSTLKKKDLASSGKFFLIFLFNTISENSTKKKKITKGWNSLFLFHFWK